MVKIFRQAASVSGLTFVSRVLGVVRDAVIASVFGTSVSSDAFFIAFRPYDLLRKLFSEGILSLSLVPVFSRYLGRGQTDQALAMFWSALFWLSVLAAASVSLGIYLAPLAAGLLAPGFAAGGYAQTLTAVLIKLMLPYLVVICCLALSMGVLNAFGNFHGPAATPILLNAGILLAVFSYSATPDRFSILTDLFFSGPSHRPAGADALVLGLGVTLGGLLQLGFQIPYLLKTGILRPRLVIFHPGLGRAARRFFPVMLGASAFQVNLLVSALLASTLGSGSISALYFADRLVQFPLALLATSAATVFLPLMSRGDGTGTLDEIRPAFEGAARLVLFMTIPAMAGIMALDRHIVALLFGRGAFGADAVAQTAGSLFFLATGLWAMAGTRIYLTCHFALSKLGLPMAASCISMAVHLACALLLKEHFGVTGLALALALGAVAGFAVLAAGSGIGPRLKGLWVSACRSLFISGIMFLLVRWAGDQWIPAQGGTLTRAACLALVVGLGAAAFFGMALKAAGPEMAILKKAMGQREWR